MRKLAIDVLTDEEVEKLFNIVKEAIIEKQAKLLEEEQRRKNEQL